MPRSETVLLLLALLAVGIPAGWTLAWWWGLASGDRSGRTARATVAIAFSGTAASGLIERLENEPIWRQAVQRLGLTCDPAAGLVVSAEYQLDGSLRLHSTPERALGRAPLPTLSTIELAPGPAMPVAAAAFVLVQVMGRSAAGTALAGLLMQVASRLQELTGTDGLRLPLRRLHLTCQAEAALLDGDRDRLLDTVGRARTWLPVAPADRPELEQAHDEALMARLCLNLGVTTGDAMRLGEGLAVATRAQVRLQGSALAGMTRLIARLRLALLAADGDPAHGPAARAVLAHAMARQTFPEDYLILGEIEQAIGEGPGGLAALTAAVQAYRRVLRDLLDQAATSAAAAGLTEVLITAAGLRQRSEDRDEAHDLAAGWLAGCHGAMSEPAEARLRLSLAGVRVARAGESGDAVTAEAALAELQRIRWPGQAMPGRLRAQQDLAEARAQCLIGQARHRPAMVRTSAASLRMLAAAAAPGSQRLGLALEHAGALAALAGIEQGPAPIADALDWLATALDDARGLAPAAALASGERQIAALHLRRAALDPSRHAGGLAAAAAALRRAMDHAGADAPSWAVDQAALGDVLLELGLSGGGTPRLQQAAAAFGRALPLLRAAGDHARAGRAALALDHARCEIARLRPAAPAHGRPAALATRLPGP